MEAFALSEDRGAALGMLVPGTPEHRYYRSLYLLGRFAEDPGGRGEDLAEVAKILTGWTRRDRGSARYQEIQWRQALLGFSKDPAATYRFLKKELGLRFDERRVAPGVAPELPTILDQELIATETLLQKYLSRGAPSALRTIRPALLEQLVRRNLTKNQRGALLDNLQRADVPGLVEVILADLAAYKNSAFGSRAIHSKLTLAQLEAMRGALPNLLSDRAYVEEVMGRLGLASTESMESPSDRRAYLDRAWAFVETLPSIFNSLKAHLLFRLVEDDLDRGAPSAERLRQYLALPRNVRYWPAGKESGESPSDLQESFQGITPFPAVGNDWDVVHRSLQELLRNESSYRPYGTWIEEDLLRRVFAETKLIYGDPKDAEQYASMLGGAAALESLRSRVELEFARGNREVFGPEESVELSVDVKNVDSLIIKAFQIDPVAVFDRFGAFELEGLDLDGLVATGERVVRYRESSLTRHRETLRLDTLKRPGIYVVELIGGGVSSRAVIHKGSLHLLGRVGAAGHVLHVIDQDRRPAKDAILRFGGRDFLPDGDGAVFVPFTTSPGTKDVLLRCGGTASVVEFAHGAEKYRLEAAVHAPSEALLTGMAASFAVRPRLTAGGEPIDLSLLKDARLVIGSKDLDGNRSSKVVTELELQSGGVFTADVQVPERTTEFTVQLTGEVRSLSAGKDVKLESEAAAFPIHGLEAMSTIQSLLTRLPGGYVLEVRGRAGEPRPDQEVRLAVEHRHFDSPVIVRLKTDAKGRIELGKLSDIASVRVTEPANLTNQWPIDSSDVQGLSSRLIGTVGDTLRIPYTGSYRASDRRAFSLLEMRGGEVFADAFDAVAIADRYLEIRGLTPGDYSLRLKESGKSIAVSVVEGPRQFGFVVGSRYALAASDATPLQILGVRRDGDDLMVQLGGVNEWTRLHAVATRYLDPFDTVSGLGLEALDKGHSAVIHRPLATFESGRIISDEYRYILQRRQQTAYPGNMLERPGYLLNPWAVSRTDDRMMDGGASGGVFGKAGGRFGGRKNLRAGGRASWGVPGSMNNRTVDFLASPGVILVGLVPGDDGWVRVPLKDLGAGHMLRLVATDDVLTVGLDVTGSEREMNRRDLRLTDGLDPARAMTQQRRILFAKAGESLRIRDAAGAGAQTYDTLGDVYDLFRTMAGEGSELVRFEFLKGWPKLPAEEKRRLYSEFVCHELNVFLRRKDPAFFADVVLPYLGNKGHRTFMDDWLLGADLKGYLEPWAFERLNVVERILLLKEVGQDAAAHAEHLMALVPRGTFSLDRAFAEVLLAGKLDTGRDGLEAHLAELQKSPAQSPKPALSPVTRSMDVHLVEEEEILEDFEVADSNEFDGKKGIPSLKDAGPAEGLGFASADKKRRDQAEGFFFRDLEPTRELGETHYWRVPLGRSDAGLITVSPFWVDFARSQGAFVPGSFPLARRNVSEMLLALALLDLPFEASEHRVQSDGRSVTITAASPLLLALEDIGDAARRDGPAQILVGQDYFRPERPTKTVNGESVEDYVTGEFLIGRAYGSRVVITNPTAASITVEALVQIPGGSVPLTNTHVTRGKALELGPYGSRALTAFFYFPETGEFGGYPVHVGRKDVLLAAAKPATFQAVAKLSKEDTTTWDWVSQNGELGEVLEFLRAGNPLALDLTKIAWRMADIQAFRQVTKTLGDQNVYSPELWKYAVEHRDAGAAREFLSMGSVPSERVGFPFDSPLLTVDPKGRALYEHLAYEPLVNGRTYAFGGRREILNDQFRDQYLAFLGQLARGPEPSGEQRMELCYYLLLQERVGEALAVFDKIDRAGVATKIQYDYMAAHLSFYREDVAAARALAERYTQHPVARWRNRFLNVLAQVDEIEGRGPKDAIDPDRRDQSQGALASKEPVLGVRVEAGKVVVDYERVDQIEVRYHRMDIEFLFSNSPFVRAEGGAFGLVQPNRMDPVTLAPGDGRKELTIPVEFQGANMLVEVRGAGLARRTTYFAGDLVVQGLERYGQVRVVDGATQKPLSKTYVKVYAKLRNGEVRFHKDGYTDLRGRFDYVSVSGVDGPDVERYAVLVMDEGSGATIHELSPPAR